MSGPIDIDAITRRGLFGVMSASAPLLWLHGTIAAADNPAATVADSGSSIRITGLKPFRAGNRLYVAILTSHGIDGWGEVNGLVPLVAEELAKSLFELLDGENPTRIEYLWQKLFRAHRDIRGGPFMCDVLAGIDMALWDVTGKLWDVPVYRLLGGQSRDKIRVYPTQKSLKVSPQRRHEASSNANEIDHLTATIKQARERVGRDGNVIFDARCILSPSTLMQLAAAVPPSDVLFMEGIALPGNIRVFQRLKEIITIPLATGERDRTIWEFISYLHEGAIDVLQPDVGHCGGITQLKKIAVLAEAFDVPLAPHCKSSPLGTAASLSVASSIPSLLIHETSPSALEWGEQFMNCTWKLDDVTGYATLPEGPGLGIRIDPDEMSKVAADPDSEWHWPTTTHPDGSIADD